MFEGVLEGAKIVRKRVPRVCPARPTSWLHTCRWSCRRSLMRLRTRLLPRMCVLLRLCRLASRSLPARAQPLVQLSVAVLAAWLLATLAFTAVLYPAILLGGRDAAAPAFVGDLPDGMSSFAGAFFLALEVLAQTAVNLTGALTSPTRRFLRRKLTGAPAVCPHKRTGASAVANPHRLTGAPAVGVHTMSLSQHARINYAVIRIGTLFAGLADLMPNGSMSVPSCTMLL